MAPVWLPGLPCRPSSRPPAAEQLLAYQRSFALPPSFFCVLNTTILAAMCFGQETIAGRHPWPLTRFEVPGALRRSKARRSIVPSVPWIHDVLTHLIRISFSVVQILGAFTRLRYPNGLFRASSMGLPYPLEKRVLRSHEPCVPYTAQLKNGARSSLTGWSSTRSTCSEKIRAQKSQNGHQRGSQGSDASDASCKDKHDLDPQNGIMQ